VRVMFIQLAILFTTLVYTKCVTDEQCKDIRLNANYWKPDEYDAYNDADLIIDGLYLGNVCAAHNESWLKENNIQLIITIAKEWKDSDQCTNGEGIKSAHFDLDDSVNEDEHKTRTVLDNAALLIKKHLSRKENGNALVHCNMGISRSSSVVLRYLQMKYPKKSYQRLLTMVQARRRVVKPNNLFGRLLTELDL
jgi:serine/threonine/tyrosine-interacting-like protein 1